MKKKAVAKKPVAKAKAKKAPAKPAKKSTPSRGGLTAAQYKKIALAFPGASEGGSYGKPAILILKKFFTRLRAEDDLIVLRVGSNDERDMLLEADPVTFTITDHYRPGGYILARLDKIDPATLKAMLERHWRTMVPKKMQSALEK